MEDWRLTGQIKYMKGIRLKKNNPHIFAKKNGKTDMWHEHCEFCMKTFTRDSNEECYSTLDDYRWICQECFDDFKHDFEWIVDNESN